MTFIVMNKELILNYCDYYIFKNQYGMNSPNSKHENYYGTLGWCPFCSKDATRLFKKLDSFTYDFGPWREIHETVWQCDCGWWQLDFYSYMEDEFQYKDWDKTVYSSELIKFFIGDKDIPIKILRSYLEKHEEKVYQINSKKMEELVASVFREHFQCEVKEVGKSHDGGVDLIMIESDKPTIIQVKRRKSPSRTEAVKEI